MPHSKARKPPAPAQPFIPDPPDPELGDALFSRKFKHWREWHNAVGFLTNLHIGMDEAQVFCNPQDPPDVLYQGVAFEIKEIMDEGRRRHDEVKQARKNALQHKDRANFTQASVIALLPEDAGRLIVAQLEGMAGRYHASVKSRTDLLFYVNKLEHWFDDGPMPSANLFEPYGWRSVSALIASGVSIVFYANASAPRFLQDNLGKVRRRYESFAIE